VPDRLIAIGPDGNPILVDQHVLAPGSPGACQLMIPFEGPAIAPCRVGESLAKSLICPATRWHAVGLLRICRWRHVPTERGRFYISHFTQPMP
jgi:hypothetical protein